MSVIIQETFADGDDKGLQLENEEWGRAMSIGSDWIRLRLGIMANLTPDGTNNILNASLRLGFSSADDDHAGSGSAGLWYGAAFGGSGVNLTGGTWTYNAGSGDPYFGLAGSARIRILNGVVSGAGTTSGPPRMVTNDGSTKRRAIFAVELVKLSGGTQMFVAPSAHTTGATNQDFTLQGFRTMLAIPPGSPLVVNGVTMTGFASTTFNDHDTNAAVHGQPVAAHIGWNKEIVNLLQILAIEAYRHE